MTTRSVLVTGASTGIGEECALHLDRLGWVVFAGVRRDEDAERLASLGSSRLVPVRLDVTNEGDVTSAARMMSERVGDQGLFGLVNNAGVMYSGPVESLPLQQWRDQFEVNVVGQVAVTKAMLPMLRTATGRVVYMSSISGRDARAFAGPYAASKHAIEAVGASLREELTPWGIRVAIIEPGIINTPIWNKAPDPDEYVAMLDADGVRLYGQQLKGVANAIQSIADKGVPASRVASAVEHALTVKRPRHRYLVGRDAWIIGNVSRLVPDKVWARLKWRY